MSLSLYCFLYVCMYRFVRPLSLLYFVIAVFIYFFIYVFLSLVLSFFMTLFLLFMYLCLAF